MTQDEFNRLPALMGRKVFQAATGLSNRDIRGLRAAGKIQVFPRPWRGGNARVLFFKRDIVENGWFGK